MKKLGFGMMRLPLLTCGKDRDILSADDIDMEQLCEMVDVYLERGFTYFDTSYVYHNGMSEAAVKKALTDRYPRERYILADKLPTFQITRKEQVPEIFEEQLKNCGVNYFDFYLLHNVWETNYDTNIKECDMFGYAAGMKEAGRVKQLGMSYHDSPEALDHILSEHPEIDFVQIALNYYDWNSSFIQAGRCYETIRKYGKKVIVMQPVKGRSLAVVPDEIKAEMEKQNPELSPASWAIRFAASLDGVLTVLSGMSNMEQILDNISYMQDFKPLNEAEKKILERAVTVMKQEKIIDCNYCGKCNSVCPQSIHISDIIENYNHIMFQRERDCNINAELNYYKPLLRRQHGADICKQCGRCTEVCPNKLDVIKELKTASDYELKNSFN